MAGSPTFRLFNTLLATMVAILVGFFCVRLKVVKPAEGHLKGLGFFIGSMVFPLLIFNTVATAELHSVNYGVIAACSLGKIAVMILTWLLAYVVFQPKRSQGQRILTASVFAFFSVASNDFAIGFPVIDALYPEKSMSIYITGNALVGSFVFVPLTMIAFAIGGAIRTGAGQSNWQIFVNIMYDLSTNPVIFMTCAGLLFKIIFGFSLVVEENGKIRLPNPFSDFIELFTSPFAMSALFLTGTSLRSPQISVWAVGMVLMKVVVCAYLSYLFATLFVHGEGVKPLQDFTFFYGAIPTSSAPIVFASQFDPEAAELVATAVLFGLVLAGPIMFITAYSLNEQGDPKNSMKILRQVQFSADAGSIFCGLLFCACLLLVRQYWCFTCPAKQLLCFYGLVLTAYAAVSFSINPFISNATCEEFNDADLGTPLVVVFSWLQSTASCMLLVLQFMHACGPRVSTNEPWKGFAFACGCFLFALLPAFLATPNTINEICNHEEFGSLQLCLNVIWSCVKLVIAASLAIYAMCRVPRASSGSDSSSEGETDSIDSAEDLVQIEQPEVRTAEVQRSAGSIESLESGAADWRRLIPRGVILTITIMNIVKVLTQVINAALVHFAFNKNMGSFASMLLLESALEHAQLIVLMAALFFDAHFTSLLLAIAGLVFSSGSEFHPDYGHFQRMNLACSRQKLREALERLKCAVGVLLAPSPAGAASNKEKETIKTAAKQMHGLQDRWTQIASKGPDGAKEILEAFSGVSYSTFVIKVPAGQSVGVDIEDRTITSVSSRKLGWSTGDTIQEINGIEAKDEEMVVNSVKAAKNQGQDLVFKVQRLSESPWVSLDRALTDVYADIDAEVVLPEPDQVSDMFRDLKNNVNLAKDSQRVTYETVVQRRKDDIIDMGTVKEKLDAFTKALDQFASS
eukprot:s206_g47.t1